MAKQQPRKLVIRDVYELLSDGQWRGLLEIVGALGHLIPPERAARKYEQFSYRHSRSAKFRRVDDDGKVERGRICLLRNMIKDSSRQGFIEIECSPDGLHRYRITDRGLLRYREPNKVTRRRGFERISVEELSRDILPLVRSA